jgi:hypothetical protein
MSVTFRRGAKLCLSAFGLALAVESTLAAYAGGGEKNCNDFGECSRAVDGSAELLKWCETSTATIASNYKRKGSFFFV